MKVLYNTPFADPWIAVAKELRDKHDLVPAFWIGNQFDNSDKLVNMAFPDCIYIPRLDLWRGIFPKDVQDNWDSFPLDIDFLRGIASFELQAIRMMDRMDYDMHSFSFIERQRLFRNNLKLWGVFLTMYKPDIVIGPIVPHRAYDYPLYLLCKKMSIPIIFFKNSAFMGRFFWAQDIYSISKSISRNYKKYKESSLTENDILSELNNDILDGYYAVQGDYSEAEPGYMKRHKLREKQESSFFGLAQRLFKLIYQNKEKYLGEDACLFKGIPSYYKEKNKSIEESCLSLFAHIRRKRKGVKMKKKLLKHYSSLTSQPNFNDEYVYLPLHYQPEMTSSPSGDIFVDQLLCVDVLVSNLPRNFKIYVKEHPSQFRVHTEGHTSRIKEFYNDLLRYRSVKLLSTDSDPFLLTKNAKAVATITGTAGWEAMVLQKPVLVFGLSWYEDYDGVLKIKDQDSAKKISSFLENYQFNERNLLCYLKAFQDNSSVAYYDMGLKDKMKQTEDECIKNLVNYLLKCI
jgi:hypothetical protein